MPPTPVPHGRAEILKLFGNPALPSGELDKGWFRENIVVVSPPGWTLYYQQSETELVKTSGISVHRLVAPSVLDVLQAVLSYASKQSDTPFDWIHRQRLDVTGGGFHFRPITGGKALSLHSWGIAIDWDPLHNPRGRDRDGKPLPWTLPEWWFELWQAHGWIDGRHFITPDPMHVQRATGA